EQVIQAWPVSANGRLDLSSDQWRRLAAIASVLDIPSLRPLMATGRLAIDLARQASPRASKVSDERVDQALVVSLFPHARRWPEQLPEQNADDQQPSAEASEPNDQGRPQNEPQETDQAPVPPKTSRTSRRLRRHWLICSVDCLGSMEWTAGDLCVQDWHVERVVGPASGAGTPVGAGVCGSQPGSAGNPRGSWPGSKSWSEPCPFRTCVVESLHRRIGSC
ncbi:MAG: hypothetical protein RL043_1513, partial [Pseudomonadota bacterium]